MACADVPPWLGAGRWLPKELWAGVLQCAGAGSENMREHPCRPNQVQRIVREVGLVPRAPAIAAVAGVEHFFIASRLKRDGSACDGIAYERPDGRKWFGVEQTVVDGDARDVHLRISSLAAVFAEELIHVWDYTLEAQGSPYFSIDLHKNPGPRWREVECDASGRPLPFDIPNRKLGRTREEQIAEDWASAVLWYLARPERLAFYSPDRHAFVEDLLKATKITEDDRRWHP